MDLVFDIETDDLKATLIHCLVAQDMDSGKIYKYPPDKLTEGYGISNKALARFLSECRSGANESIGVWIGCMAQRYWQSKQQSICQGSRFR